MAVFMATFLFMLLVVAAMSIGVLAGRSPIKGSCGGMSALGLGTECEICGGDPGKCDSDTAPAAKPGRAEVYDAMRTGPRARE
jgi:hypothetical protein